MRVGLQRKLSAKELMFLNCGVGEDSCESLGLQGECELLEVSAAVWRWLSSLRVVHTPLSGEVIS